MLYVGSTVATNDGHGNIIHIHYAIQKAIC